MLNSDCFDFDQIDPVKLCVILTTHRFGKCEENSNFNPDEPSREDLTNEQVLESLIGRLSKLIEPQSSLEELNFMLATIFTANGKYLAANQSRNVSFDFSCPSLQLDTT